MSFCHTTRDLARPVRCCTERNFSIGEISLVSRSIQSPTLSYSMGVRELFGEDLVAWPLHGRKNAFLFSVVNKWHTESHNTSSQRIGIEAWDLQCHACDLRYRKGSLKYVP